MRVIFDYHHLLCSVCLYYTAMPRPDPPEVVTVNHYSVELRWSPELHDTRHPKVRYCYILQQEDCSRQPRSGYVTVYK